MLHFFAVSVAMLVSCTHAAPHHSIEQSPPGHGKLLQFNPANSLSSLAPAKPSFAFDLSPHPNAEQTAIHLAERKEVFLHSSKRRHLQNDLCATAPVSVKVGDTFSLGHDGKTPSSYANSQSCTWLVEDATALPPGSTIGIAFTFFHTEENSDTVQIYDAATDTLISTHSGDELTVFIVAKKDVHRLKVVFTSNEAVSESSRTLQLGFSATVYDAGADCFASQCNAHGQCDTTATPRVCKCTQLTSDTDLQSVWVGDTCSTQIAYLKPNTPTLLAELPINEWSYFWSEVDTTTKYLVDFKDTGSPDSDPLLVLGSASTITDKGQWNPVLPR